MRKILLTLLIVSVVSISAVAAWFFSQSTTPGFNEAELQAALATLAPTEAEAKAITALRQKSLAQWHNRELPAEAEPVNDENVQITLEYRFISASGTSKIASDPAMSWSGLPASTQSESLENANMTGAQVPMHVRYLEETNARKFIELLQSRRHTIILEPPKILLCNRQLGKVNDTTAIPFVTGILPIEVDDAVCYEPIITHVNAGQTYKSTATLLQDGSVRLNSQVDFTHLVRVENYSLMAAEQKEGDVIIKGDAIVKTDRGAITIQQPIYTSFRTEIPDVVIPEGMSLLVAIPRVRLPEIGYKEGDGDQTVFLLITPRRVDGEAVANGNGSSLQM